VCGLLFFYSGVFLGGGGGGGGAGGEARKISGPGDDGTLKCLELKFRTFFLGINLDTSLGSSLVLTPSIIF
jgi:hypothetical protein